MIEGYIKLYRKSLESEVFSNNALWKTWCYCLLKANHKESWVSIQTGKGYSQIKVQTGQFIWGSKVAGKEMKIAWKSAYNYLKKLETIGNLSTKVETHYTIVSISNWEIYQNGKKKNGKALARQRKPNGKAKETQWQGTGKALETNKNVKNDKNVENDENVNNDEKLSPYPLSEVRETESVLPSEKDFEKDSGQRSEKERLSYQLLGCILQIKPDHSFAIQKPNMNIWSDYFENMIVNRLRSFDRINKVIGWLPKNTFWANKMLSKDVLLVFDRNFDMMEYQMLNNNGHTNDSNNTYEKFAKNVV